MKRSGRSRGWGCALIVMVCALALALLVWFSVQPWRADFTLRDGNGLERALAYYVCEYDRQLPQTGMVLADNGLIRVLPDGAWEVPPRDGDCAADGSPSTWEVRHPERFDVAWGAMPEELDETGFLPARGRFLVEPAPSWQDHPGLMMACRIASARAAKIMRDAGDKDWQKQKE